MGKLLRPEPLSNSGKRFSFHKVVIHSFSIFHCKCCLIIIITFLAATSHHSGDWLFAMPIVAYETKLDDEALRVAVGVRLYRP